MLCGLGMQQCTNSLHPWLELCGLGMQQCAMHNTTIHKTTFFELGVYIHIYIDQFKKYWLTTTVIKNL